MDEIPVALLTGLTPSALLSLGFILIMWGKLVPKATLDEARHDRDMWRAAHMISEQARVESAAQVEELLEHARTTDAFIRSLETHRSNTP